MKKLLFAILAAAAIVSFASCGGSNSSSDKKDKGDTVQTDNKSSNEQKGVTVEEQAVEMFKKMYDAGENDDLKKFTKLAKEFDKWFKKLSTEDQEKVNEAVFDWDEEKAEMIVDAANDILY